MHKKWSLNILVREAPMRKSQRKRKRSKRGMMNKMGIRKEKETQRR